MHLQEAVIIMIMRIMKGITDMYVLYRNMYLLIRSMGHIDNACIFSLLSPACCEVFHASLSIAVNPTRHFSYSSGSLSSMYLPMLDFACCLRYDRSLLIVPLDTCNICAISLWLCPWLLSSWPHGG